MYFTGRISFNTGKSYHLIFYALALVVLGTIILMFILPVNGDDSWIHLNWLDQFTRLFREGNLYPRWMPESFSGYGSAAFYFYPPLPFWIASLTSLIVPSASPEVLFYFISLLGSVVSVMTMKSYLKEIGISQEAALLGSFLYGFGAYRILDIFSRNSMSEQFAMIFLPLIFKAIEIAFSTSTRNSIKAYIIFTIGFTGAILSNIPTAAVASTAGAIYCLLRLRKENVKNLLSLIVGVMGSIALSGIYILPMVFLRPQAHFERLFDLSPGFAAGKAQVSYLISVVFLDLRITTIISLISGTLLFIFLLRYKKFVAAPASKQLAMTFSFLFLFAIIVQIPYFGYYLHSTIFPFSLLQFYWRWNILLTFMIPAVIALFISEKSFPRLSLFIFFISIVAIIAVMALQFFNPARPASFARHRDVREYIPYSVKTLPKASDKYVPLRPEWFDFDSSQFIMGSADGITTDRIDPFRYRIISSLDTTRTVTLHQFYWEEWKLENESGKEMVTVPDSTGKTTMTLPAGHHTYFYYLHVSQAEIYGEILSGIGAFTFLIVIAIQFRLKKRNHNPGIE